MRPVADCAFRCRERTTELTVIADRWFFPAPIARTHRMAMTEKPSSP